MSNFKTLVRLGKEAVVRYTKEKGKPVVSFSAACDVGHGERKKTLWLDCSAWGERFVKVAEYLKKGALVLVEGDLSTREHEGKTYLTLDVADLQLAGSKPAAQ